MLNVNSEIASALNIQHSTFNIPRPPGPRGQQYDSADLHDHLTFNIPRPPRPRCQQHDSADLHDHQPRAPLNPEPSAGHPLRAAAANLEHGAARHVAADVVAEDRSGEEIPGEVDADGEPQPL